MADRLPAPRDWDRHEVVAAVRRRGLTIAHLARENGLSSGAFSQALVKPYPRAERIIADALGLRVEDIWPLREQRRRVRALSRAA